MTMTLNVSAPTPHPTVSAQPPAELQEWVDKIATLTTPDAIVWCDGSPAESAALIDTMVAQGTLTALDPTLRPNSFVARSEPSDVARVESRTFICSRTPR